MWLLENMKLHMWFVLYLGGQCWSRDGLWPWPSSPQLDTTSQLKRCSTQAYGEMIFFFKLQKFREMPTKIMRYHFIHTDLPEGENLKNETPEHVSRDERMPRAPAWLVVMCLGAASLDSRLSQCGQSHVFLTGHRLSNNPSPHTRFIKGSGQSVHRGVIRCARDPGAIWKSVTSWNVVGTTLESHVAGSNNGPEYIRPHRGIFTTHCCMEKML